MSGHLSNKNHLWKWFHVSVFGCQKLDWIDVVRLWNYKVFTNRSCLIGKGGWMFGHVGWICWKYQGWLSGYRACKVWSQEACEVVVRLGLGGGCKVVSCKVGSRGTPLGESTQCVSGAHPLVAFHPPPMKGGNNPFLGLTSFSIYVSNVSPDKSSLS